MANTVTCVCGCGKAIPAINKKGQPARYAHGHNRGALIDGRTRLQRAGELPEYRAWSNMITRCTNPRVRSYKDYGGRGIEVCEEWRADFLAFFRHIGPRPSADLQLDRIDNDGDYEPGNVRWATRTEQARNKRPRVV